MTFLIKAIIQHDGHPPREVTVRIAGCTDAEDAKRKMRDYYPVQKFKSVTEFVPTHY